MPVRNLKKIDSKSREINKFQQNVEEFVGQFFKDPILDGVLLKEVVLTTGSVNEISHNLGRDLRGWVVTRKKGDSRIWDSQDSQTFKQRFLSLNCSANVTVDLWVF